MDLQKIKILCSQKNIRIKDLCAKIGMTDAGLYKAINNGKISSEYLEKISKELNVPVGMFFGENNNSVLIDTLKHRFGFAQFESSFTYIIEYWAKQKDSIIVNGKKRSKYEYVQELFDNECLFDIKGHEYENEILKLFYYLFDLSKTSREDFIVLKDNGIISKTCCKMLVLWVTSDYDLGETVRKYEQYLMIQSIGEI